MSIEEMPIAAIRASHRTTGDGVHLVARRYRKGVRLHTHMHREAQLVFAAKGTMQVTTPKGRWLVPPDRAVWVPPRLEHSIDVLADIEMRTLYFDSAWLAREQRSDSLEVEFVVRVSRLLHETILALFDGGTDPDRTGLLTRLAVLSCITPRIPRPSFRCPMSHAAAARRTSCLPIRRLRTRSRRWRERSGPRRGRCRGCFPRRRN